MKYQTFKYILSQRGRVYDSCAGTGTDSGIDANPQRNPNDYLVRRIDRTALLEWLMILATVLVIVGMFISIPKMKVQ